MTPDVHRSWKREIWRWLIAAVAVLVAGYAALSLSVLVLFFGQYPKDLAEPTAGFLLSSLLIIAGSLLVPRYRVPTAVVLFMLAASQGARSWSYLLGTLAGGLVAGAFVAWWFQPRRTVRATLWVSLAAGAAVFVFIGFVYARYVDWPARPEPPAPDLADALGTHVSRISAFYSYDLGGFLDREWLWRIDAKPDVVAFVVRQLGMLNASAVPQKFWRMPPHYWPRSMPAGGEAFQSPMFPADSRGQDGAHFFLLHDKAQGRAFVWFKENF